MTEWIAMSLLAAALVLVAGYYLRKAIGTLRRTTPAFEMLPDERRYLRRQAWRRIVNSMLMLLLAAMLVGSYAAGMQQRADEIGRLRELQQDAEGRKPPLTDEQRDFGRLFGYYWIALLLLLGVVVALAGWDLLATRRYAINQLRRIQSDRRAMLQRQITRWREERNGFPSEE